MQGKLTVLVLFSKSDRRAGVALLDKALFTAYVININARTSDNGTSEGEEITEIPPFEINVASLLETLQIFGTNDDSGRDRWSSRETRSGSSFDRHNVLGVSGLCRLSYHAVGDPFRISLEESGLTTTAELTTYEPSVFDELPLQKDHIVQKIIMKANWLHDAITELASTSPTRITVTTSPEAPFFALSSVGPLGSARFEFNKDPQLLETFQVTTRTSNTYKYSMVKSASRAMAAAAKVSIRTDIQGVLSLQFMVATEQEGGSSGFSFIDFRFVPYLNEEDGDEAVDEDAGDHEAVMDEV